MSADYDTIEALKVMEAQGNIPVEDLPHPTKENVYLIVRMQDGNYKGFAAKNGKQYEVRDVNPETVLQLLITHSE